MKGAFLCSKLLGKFFDFGAHFLGRCGPIGKLSTVATLLMNPRYEDQSIVDFGQGQI